MSTEPHALPGEPEKIFSIDAEYLAGHRFAYQSDIALVEGSGSKKSIGFST